MSERTLSEPAYFGSWTGYGMPRVPCEPLTADQIGDRTAYYQARYDDGGRLAEFTKFLDGQVAWRDQYDYWPDGTLRQRRLVASDGATRVETYDRRGRLIGAR